MYYAHCLDGDAKWSDRCTYYVIPQRTPMSHYSTRIVFISFANRQLFVIVAQITKTHPRTNEQLHK